MPQAHALQQCASTPFNAQALLDWYDRTARDLPWRVGPAGRKQGVSPDPYRVWLSEIMLQQTTVAAVRDYFALFLHRWPSVQALAAAPLDQVLAAWAGLGYYARARNLHAAAQQVAGEMGGVFPATAAGLQQLPGVGPYTAAAIAAICFDERIAVLDGNVERVMARVLALEVPVRDAKSDMRAELQTMVPARAGDFAQAMMDLGATLCAPHSAACMLCPLQPDCKAAKLPEPTVLPIRPARAKKPQRFGHAYAIFHQDGAVWLRTRPAKGLLAKMTELPGSDWSGEGSAAAFPLAGNWQAKGQVIHVFTHFHLTLDVWALKGAARAPDGPGWWSPPQNWQREALPSLFQKVLLTATE